MEQQPRLCPKRLLDGSVAATPLDRIRDQSWQRVRRLVPDEASRRSTIPTLRASKPTSLLSCRHTTSQSTSKPSGGRPHLQKSATHGRHHPKSSNSIHVTSSRDQSSKSACGPFVQVRQPVQERGPPQFYREDRPCGVRGAAGRSHGRLKHNLCPAVIARIEVLVCIRRLSKSETV